VTYANPSSTDRLCNVCRLPVATHLRCGACEILVGPGHDTTALVDGQHCFTCRRTLDRWEAAEARIGKEDRATIRRLGVWSS